MPIKTFNDRLTQQDYINIQKWDKILKDEDKSFENAKRRDRYHNLRSLDENISNEGRQTDRYDLIASDSLDGEQTYIYNEIVECSDKTVTNHFKKHQEVLQDILKDYR